LPREFNSMGISHFSNEENVKLLTLIELYVLSANNYWFRAKLEQKTQSLVFEINRDFLISLFIVIISVQEDLIMAGLAPQVIVNVKDETASNVGTIKTPLPLDKPFYALIAQKGQPGLNYYYNFTDAKKEFGAETFNESNTTYFTRTAMYAKASFENNGCWMMRLIPDDAAKSRLVLYLTIKASEIPQYTKAANGSRVLNATGDWVPALDTNDDPVTLPGYSISWSIGDIPTGKTFDTLEVTTTVIPLDGTYVKYPILALQEKSGGLTGNNTGIELYYNPAQNTTDKLEVLKNLRWAMRIKSREYNSSTVDYVRDAFDAVENSFTLAPDVIDTQLSMNVGINDILQTRYYADNLISFDYHAYNNNYITICQLLADTMTAAEKASLGDLFDDTTAGVLNLMSCINPFTEFEYDTIEIDTGTSANMIQNITHFMTGGSDGDISTANEFEMLQDVYNLNTYPDIRDAARYPMTVIYDPGYCLPVKYAMLDFLATREDVVAILGTYQYADVLGVPLAELTQAEDLAVGQALYSRALLMRESALFGTPATRVGIFCQSGVPNNSIKNTVVPAGTFWWCSKFSERFNRTTIYSRMSPAPNNINDLFTKLNWTPSSIKTETALWNAGLNYCQYYDDVQLFYAGLRSVYPYDTSTLLDLEFVFMICFAKQIAYKVWAQRTGSDEQSDTRFYNTKALAANLLNTMLNGRCGSTVNVYQTADEANIGYIDHIQIGLQKAKASTVHYVDVIAQKYTAI